MFSDTAWISFVSDFWVCFWGWLVCKYCFFTCARMYCRCGQKSLERNGWSWNLFHPLHSKGSLLLGWRGSWRSCHAGLWKKSNADAPIAPWRRTFWCSREAEKCFNQKHNGCFKGCLRLWLLVRSVGHRSEFILFEAKFLPIREWSGPWNPRRRRGLLLPSGTWDDDELLTLVWSRLCRRRKHAFCSFIKGCSGKPRRAPSDGNLEDQL